MQRTRSGGEPLLYRSRGGRGGSACTPRPGPAGPAAVRSVRVAAGVLAEGFQAEVRTGHAGSESLPRATEEVALAGRGRGGRAQSAAPIRDRVMRGCSGSALPVRPVRATRICGQARVCPVIAQWPGRHELALPLRRISSRRNLYMLPPGPSPPMGALWRLPLEFI